MAVKKKFKPGQLFRRLAQFEADPASKEKQRVLQIRQHIGNELRKKDVKRLLNKNRSPTR